ncbi:MAG: four helix bundle protein [Bacteroidetes bacterium]|nr:MAG: four helix bundle protein [Bacteroidota bacterium]RLD80409.1 MAG: four helix bundle protein [Bacteroidota bacterium]
MKNDLKARTFKFSIDVISLVEMLPKNQATGVISYQILKSGTSVGANYRAAKRGRSDREFISKINIVLEEADETLFWLEVIKEKNWIQNELLDMLLKEADELTAIFTSTLITMNRKKGRN